MGNDVPKRRPAYLGPLQFDQIGRLLKVLEDKVSIKSSPNAWCVFGLLQKATLFMLNYCDSFLGKFRKNLGYF